MADTLSYRIFPVKYQKAIVDTEVTTIIMETAEAITERRHRDEGNRCR